MSLNNIVVRASAHASPAALRRRAPLLALLVLFLSCGSVSAEGTRTLHPAGATGNRGVLDASDSSFFANVARGRQFLYVHAQAGEYILLGSRNRSDGGDVFVYDPQSFGVPGDETIPATADFACSSQAGRGTIGGRAAELAGPNSADGTATVPDGYTPCSYLAPATGIYGVRFTGATSGGQTNTASIATPPILTGNLVSAWDVTVRASADSLSDINGRLFTYAWTVYLQSNGRRLDNDLYYVSSDGYRYRQSMRGIDPNRAAFYANARGFIDTDGGPLYRDIRGNNAAVTAGPSISAGVTAQRPQFPIFFSDVSPSGANAAEVDRVLAALAIPLAPLPPQLASPTFVGNVGGNTSTVSTGGMFTFTTLNTLTYEIVISRDGIDFDPANVLNRVLTGIALSGNHAVLWDGLDNDGNAFPVGEYDFRIVGRNGEIHFPMIDIEANAGGGPTLTKLNGTLQEATTVYFDDRGYTTANGTLIGALNGHLCGAGSLIAQPAPNHSLIGVDSADANFAGGGNYYRSWGGSADNNNDCTNNATQYFATAKGLDLWALEKSEVTELPIEIVDPTDGVDVGTMVAVTPAVLPGETAYGSFVFTNAGDEVANGATYGVVLGNPAQPATCPASVNFALVPAGIVATYNPAPSCTITFTGMPATLAPGDSLNFNFDYVVLPANPGPIPVATSIAATNETPGAPAPNAANAQTIVAKPVINVSKSSSPTPGTEVDVGDTITYTLSATIANAPLTATLTLADSLGAGLDFASIASSHPAFSCGGSLACTLPAGTAIGTYTVVYTASVNPTAAGSVANNVVATGGGGDDAPTCAPCSVDHPLVPPPAFPFCPAAGDPARVFNVVNGVEIYGYTPPGTLPDVLLPLVPAAISGNLNALMLDPVRNRLLMIQRSSGTQSTLWAYDPANGGWYVASAAFTSPDFPRGGFNAAGTGYLLGGGATPEVWVVESSSTFGYSVTQLGTVNYDHAPTDVGSGDLAFDGNGRAWLAVGQDIYHLDLGGTSPFTAVRQTRPLLGGSPSTIGWAGIAFADDGTLILANNAPAPSAYYQYDPASGVIVHRVDTTPNAARDLASCAFPVQLEPELSLTKRLAEVNGAPYVPPAAVSPGDTLTYTITVANSGGAVATLFPGDVVEAVPANTTHAGGDDFSCAAATAGSACGNAVALNLPAGSSIDLAFVVQANPVILGASIDNAVAIPGEVDCLVAPNDCNEVTPVNPSVTLAKTLQSGGPQAEPGETLTYAITLTNSTGTPATNYGVTDVLDPNVAFVAASNGGSHAGGTVTWAGLVVPPNGSLALTVQVAVADPLPAGATAILNLAYETGTTPPACPPASANCVVTPTAPNVSLVKALTDESGGMAGIAEAGEQLTYTITLANSGGSDATAYGVTDLLDPNVAFASTDNGGAHAAGVVTWSGLVVPAGGSVVLTVVVTVDDPIPAGVTQILNLVHETGMVPPACPPGGPQCVIVPTEPAIAIVKSASTPAPTGNPDEYAITYVVTATNSGGSTGRYDLADTLTFNGATVTAISPPAYDATTGDIQDGALGAFAAPSGGTIVANESIGAGGSESWTYTVTYSVDDGDLASDCSVPNGGLRNRALLGGDASGAPAAETCSGAPSVGVVKTATAPAPTGNPNEFTLTYTVDISNTGSLAGVYDLDDTLAFNGATVSAISMPAYSSASDVQDGTPGTFVAPDGGTIVTDESISAGGAERWSYTVTYAVTDAGTAQDCADPSGGLRNSASLGGSLSGESNTCTGAPAVVIGKSVSGPNATGNPGEYTLDYLVTVQNDGSVVGNYDLVDTFSFAGVTVSSVSAVVHGGVDPLAGALGALTPTGGTIVGGETIAPGASETYAYTVTFALDDLAAVGTCAAGGGLVNQAALGGSSAGQVGTCSDMPDLMIDKGVGTPVPTGMPNQYTLAYTVSVANAGAAAGSYDLADVFDFAGATIDAVSAVSHVGPDPLGGVPGTLTPTGGTIVAGETIAAGSGESFIYAVTFTLTDPAAAADCTDPAGGLRNTAAFGGSAVGDAQTCTAMPDVAIVKNLAGEGGVHPGVAEPGEQLTYTITLTNTGGTDATGYGVTDVLDPNTNFVSTDNGGVHAAGVVTWSSLTVPANGVLSLSVVVAVADPLPAGVTQVANVVYETGTSPPACPPAGGQCVVVPTLGAVTIAKALTGEDGVRPGVAEPGEQLAYTITLTNSGGTDATGYGVTDALDPNTIFVSADQGGVHAAGVVDWSGLTVPANGVLSLNVVVAVVDPLPAGVTQVANVAYETGTSPPTCPPDGPQCVVVPVDGAVAISKSVTDASGNGQAEAGEQLTYTITLANTGGSDVTGYGVTDPLDPNVSFVSADSGGVHAGGVVSWSGLAVPAGATLDLVVVVDVVDPLPAGVTGIGNLAYETGTTPPDCSVQPVPANCVDIPVAGLPHLMIAKEADNTTLEPGGLVVYTITIGNDGEADATDALVSDPLPDGIIAFAWICSASGGAVCPNAAGTGAINEVVAVFPVGGMLVYSVTATLSDDPPSSVVNTATVTPGDDATCGPDNTAPPCPATVIGTVVPGGVADVQPVPTLGTWMMFLLGLCMLGLGWQARRRPA